MQIPNEILNKTQQILKKRHDREEIRKKIEAERKKRIDKLNLLRKSRENELQQYARGILRWIDQFLGTEASYDILSVCNPILLFPKRFWCDLPIDSRTEFASISLKVRDFSSMRVGTIFYEEYSGKQELIRRQECADIVDLVNTLHPDCLKQFYESLQDGTVWKIIEKDLSRFAS